MDFTWRTNRDGQQRPRSAPVRRTVSAPVAPPEGSPPGQTAEASRASTQALRHLGCFSHVFPGTMTSLSCSWDDTVLRPSPADSVTLLGLFLLIHKRRHGLKTRNNAKTCTLWFSYLFTWRKQVFWLDFSWSRTIEKVYRTQLCIWLLEDWLYPFFPSLKAGRI